MPACAQKARERLHPASGPPRVVDPRSSSQRLSTCARPGVITSPAYGRAGAGNWTHTRAGSSPPPSYLRLLLALDRDAHNVAARVGTALHLLHSALHVRGQRRRHRLGGEFVLRADLDRPDVDGAEGGGGKAGAGSQRVGSASAGVRCHPSRETGRRAQSPLPSAPMTVGLACASCVP